MTRRVLLALALVAGSVPADGGPAPEVRLREADRRWRSGSLLRAQRILEDLEREARVTADRRLLARVRRDLGRTLRSRGERVAGQAAWDAALADARAAADPAIEASILVAEGYAAWAEADYATASDLAARASRLQERAGDAGGRAATLVLEGRIALKAGRYGPALRLLDEARAIQEGRRDPQGLADAHQAVGEALMDLRSFAAADEAFSRRLALAREIGDRAQEAHALNQRGFVRRFGGDLEGALAQHEEALRTARLSGDEGAVSHALHALGSVHRDLGRLPEASAEYEDAIRLREAAGDPRSRAWSLAGLARVRRERGELRASLDAYRDAAAQFAALADRRALAWHLYEVARLLERLDEPAEAGAAYERALAEMEAIDLPYRCLALADYGLLRAGQGRAAEALAAARRGRMLADATGNPEMRWSAARGEGRILVRLGRREEALAPYLEAVALVEAMTAQVLPSDEAKSGFYEDRQSVFEETAGLLVDLGRAEEGLEIAERARTRAFLDLLAGPGQTGSLTERTGVDRPKPGRPSGRPAEPLERGGSEVPSGRRRGSLPSPVHAAAPDRAAIRAEAARRGVPILEYLAGSDRLLAWLVPPHGPVRAIAAPVGRQELLAEAEKAREALGGEAARRRLHRLLLEPFEPMLPDDPGSPVLVIPHGPLFLVSLGGLPDAAGRYGVERHAVAYAPSIGVLRTLGERARRAGRRSGALVVGNPLPPARAAGQPPLPSLPGAEAEADAVRRAWPGGEVAVLRGAEATEAAVRRLAARRSVLHLATHGLFVPDDPLGSWLALTPDRADDGRLTAREVFERPVGADLVVLSACDTGRGRIGADGVAGLGRAFLHAGAGAVVASLWRVADAVALRQMERFHREMRAGTPAAEALRRAQADSLRELRAGAIRTGTGAPIGADPAYWAAFVLMGDPDGVR